MRPLYIFDLDGTLRDLSHRLHHLTNLRDKERWRKFEAECGQDQPIPAVIKTMNALRATDAEIWIFSGCSTAVRQQTIQWLTYHTDLTEAELDLGLTMRDVGDYNPDDALKQLWLSAMLMDDRRRLVAVFDDRQRVVDMWRANGIACFQVRPGNF